MVSQDELEARVAELEGDVNRKFSTLALFSGSKAQLDALGAGCRNGATAWCSNGRKAGEGVGAGTGVPVYFDQTSGDWMSYRTDAEVLI